MRWQRYFTRWANDGEHEQQSDGRHVSGVFSWFNWVLQGKWGNRALDQESTESSTKRAARPLAHGLF